MKILILTGTFGSGHNSVAAAISASLKKRLPGASITVTDLPSYLSKEGASLWYSVFGTVVTKMSPLYNAYYKVSALADSGKRLSPLLIFRQKTEELLQREDPRLVVAVHPVCAYLAGQCRLRGGRFTLVTCLTDLSTHPEWVNEGTDYYCVGARDIALCLQSHGVPEERILLTGVPLRQEFYAPVRKQPHEQLELLLMGGGLGLLPPEPAFYRGLSQLPGVHATVITGHNRKLYDRLAGRFPGLTVLGYTPDVRWYMEQADLMVSKAGGITLFEALYTGLPLLVPEPTLAQEARNAAFAEAHDTALLAPRDPNGCLDAIARLMADPLRLRRMSEAARRLRETLDPGVLAELAASLSGELEGGNGCAA